MPCYGPLFGYYSKEVNASGRRSIVFDKRKSFSGIPILIPCGECIGCRMSWRRQWATRCLHEKRLHGASAFVTLTYDGKSIPALGSLRIRHLQLFMKRLRKERPCGLRFFACGEYGSTLQRPHYHVLLFNTDFPDMRFWKNSASGEALFSSVELDRIWNLGDAYIGTVTARSCAYVAGYVTKKVGREVDYAPREAEFRVMSRRPGIGCVWFERFHDEAYRHDSVIVDFRETGIPRYYDTKFVSIDPVRLSVLKRARKRSALFSHPEDQSKARMLVRERFELLKEERFKREV